MIESIRKIFLIALIVAIIALVASTVIRANRAIAESDATITRVDALLASLEGR